MATPLEYPRYVHGPSGEHRLVSTVEEREAALADGYRDTPFLTPQQEAAVKAAKIAAGELQPDPEPKSKKGKE